MGTWRYRSIIGAIAIVASAYFAQGAEIVSEPPIAEMPPVTAPAMEFGGWYLRGDISVDWVDEFDVVTLGNPYTSSGIDQGYNFGIGVGYQLNEKFRADVTIERFGSDFSGSTAASCAYDGGGVIIAGSCASIDSADFTAWSAMANAYFDLGNFGGFTPYAGVGVGASFVSWDDYSSRETCTRPNVATDSCYLAGNTNYVPPGAGAPATTSTISYAGDDSWKFSYALMAGFSYDLSKQLKLDVGYKYTNIIEGALLPNIGGGISADHDNIGVHAARVGLRYQIQ